MTCLKVKAGSMLAMAAEASGGSGGKGVKEERACKGMNSLCTWPR